MWNVEPVGASAVSVSVYVWSSRSSHGQRILEAVGSGCLG